MRNLLVHGCYDRATLNTLTNLGIKRIAFDLRATSPNLIPFKELLSLLQQYNAEEIVLTFQNDKQNTVLSFLDLLKDEPFKILLEFRDQKDITYYHSLNVPFLWMFHPEADWKNIMLLRKLKGVLLPLKWKEDYQEQGELWDIIEQRNLEVFLHAENFEDAQELSHLNEINLSLDLTAEIETGYRRVDQELLKKMELWSKLNENSPL
ncbi:MAG TPA: hypothetical protein VNJ08_09450 [Bacteriovoracaceae bacterium]|nr:hypothetical protein [Bacteriovoracaceae bacterium]